MTGTDDETYHRFIRETKRARRLKILAWACGSILAVVLVIAALRTPESTVNQGKPAASATALQRALTAAGYDPGPIDGAYGPQTEAARKARQDDVCRVALSLFGTKITPRDVSRFKTSGKVMYYAHVREVDQTVWRSRCKLQGNKVIWGPIRSDGTRGRWFTNPQHDSVVTWRIADSFIHIREVWPDGGKGREDSFTRDELTH